LIAPAIIRRARDAESCERERQKKGENTGEEKREEKEERKKSQDAEMKL